MAVTKMILNKSVVTLLSNAQPHLFPNNTAFCFTNRLPHLWEIPSAERWKVGVSEFSTLNTLNVIPIDLAMTVDKEDKMDNSSTTVYRVPRGNYSMDSFISFLKRLWSKQKLFTFRIEAKDASKPSKSNETQDFYFSIKPNEEGYRFTFDSRLQSILGLKNAIISGKEEVQADRPILLSSFAYNILLYCKFIKPSIQGGQFERVLRTIPFPLKQASVENYMTEFRNIEFHDIATSTLEDLSIELRDDSGEVLPLNEGRTMVKLVFIKE